MSKKFINNLVKSCQIDSKNIFLVPGNHDVDRSKIGTAHIKWWYNFLDENSLNEVLGSDDSFPKIKGKKDAYFTFAEQYMNTNFLVGKFGQYVHEIKIDEKCLIKVKIVGINSALFCGYEGDDNQNLH